MTEWYSYIRDAIVILATCSAALVAYNNYRKQKRNEITAELRKLVAQIDYNCQRLNILLNYEVLHEIIAEVVYSHQMNTILADMTMAITNGEKYEEEELPKPVTTSIHSPILNEYENLLKSNSEACGRLAELYPSLHRIFESINTMFSSIIVNIKEISRNEKILANIYFKIIKTGCRDIKKIEDEMFYYVLDSITKRLMSIEQKNINDALSIISLTREAIIRQSDKNLGNILKKSKRIKLKDINATKTIFDDFREAEQGVTLIFSADELLSFRELYIKMKVRKEN